LIAQLDAGALTPDEALRLLRGEMGLFQVCAVFWGGWMLPLGWLSYRAGLVPRAVGIGLIAGGLGYISSFVQPVLGTVLPTTIGVAVMAVTLGSELLFMGW